MEDTGKDADRKEEEGKEFIEDMPAKAGSTFFGVMRHSVRVDENPDAEWSDKLARPYDCPIEDFELPAQQIPQLQGFGFTRIVCSPFRRCLQTAGIIARALDIKQVMVHLGVGEVMSKVKTAILASDEPSGMRARTDVFGGTKCYC